MSKKTLLIITGPMRSRKHLIALRLAHHMEWLGYKVFQTLITNDNATDILKQKDDMIKQNDLIILHGHENYFNISTYLQIKSDQVDVIIIHSRCTDDFSEEDMVAEILISGINKDKKDAEQATILKLEDKSSKKNTPDGNIPRKILYNSKVPYMYINHGNHWNKETSSYIPIHTDISINIFNFIKNMCISRSSIYLLSPDKATGPSFIEKISQIIGKQPLHIFSGEDDQYIEIFKALRAQTTQPQSINILDDGITIVRSFSRRPTGQNLDGLSKEEIFTQWIRNPAIDAENKRRGLNTDTKPTWENIAIALKSNMAIFDKSSPFSYYNRDLSKEEMGVARQSWALIFENYHEAKIGIGNSLMKKEMSLYFTNTSDSCDDGHGNMLLELIPKNDSIWYDVVKHSV